MLQVYIGRGLCNWILPLEMFHYFPTAIITEIWHWCANKRTQSYQIGINQKWLRPRVGKNSKSYLLNLHLVEFVYEMKSVNHGASWAAGSVFCVRHSRALWSAASKLWHINLFAAVLVTLIILRHIEDDGQYRIQIQFFHQNKKKILLSKNLVQNWINLREVYKEIATQNRNLKFVQCVLWLTYLKAS